MHTSLTCSRCAEPHAIDRPQNLCVRCGKPLLAGYDLAGLAGRFTPEAVRSRTERSMWRFREVLPVADGDEPVSLGEGSTPLLRAVGRGSFGALEQLWIKDESFNPTASFKARGMSAAITAARALGIRAVALPSAGNAGGAAAAYAARAGIECHLFMPADTPPANLVEAREQGAHVTLIDGLISDCGRHVQEGCRRHGWFDLSTLKEPFRIEGKKTLGYELALDFGADLASPHSPVSASPHRRVAHPSSHLPDVVIYPTGGGTGLIGMWKAFDEMQQLGWMGAERPRMVVVQAEGCAPIVRAWQEGAEEARFFEDARSCAAGLRVPAAVGDFLMLRILRESRGTALAVSDRELLEGARELAREQGIFACPEGGATWAAAKRLLAAGWLRPDERIVAFNTASGLKYVQPEMGTQPFSPP